MYGINYASAARRHFAAAEALNESTRRNVAGYLFGIAAECALKEIMRASGMKPLAEHQRRDDPFFAHFQTLKSMLRDKIKGRRSTELRHYAESSSFMQYWDVAMRYSDGKRVKAIWVERWHLDAKRIVIAMDT